MMKNITSADALRSLCLLRNESSEAWDGAIDDADGDNQDEAIGAAEEALDYYDKAIDLLERLDDPNWRTTARNHLCDAKTLEDEWGDSSCAISAIEAIDSINTED